MRYFVTRTGVLVGLIGTTATWTAHAAPTLRYQVDQPGDILLTGNTLGHDCGNGTPAPIVGSVGACGSSVSDSSPDVFWSADAPTSGQASASSSIPVGQARSTAVLTIPTGAEVTYARLYWAALRPGTEPDDTVTLGRPGTFSMPITADSAFTHTVVSGVQYQASANVTDLIVDYGSGPYRVAGVDSIVLSNVAEPQAFAAWALVIFYELPSEPLRQLSLFDGLDPASSGNGATVDISGFLVPNTGIDAKLGVLAYGGDGQTGGDTLEFNTVLLEDGVSGGTNNFFNSSRTWLGLPVSTVGDLPQLSGSIRSHSGVDLDVVDVTSWVTPGSTSAQAVAKAGGDNNLLLGAWITSITTYKPNFNETLKQATDVDGGALLVGDVVEYTIDVINTGNDPALDVVLTDELPLGVTYVPGSIRITSGPNTGAKTDAVDADQAEYDSGARLITVRLGEGADGTNGGSMDIDATTTVAFQVTIDGGTEGLSLSNQATITARGLNGAPTTDFHSDDGSNTGSPTDIIIDGCETDAQCSAPTPHCYDPPDPSVANECVECLSSADCSGFDPTCELSDHTCRPCYDDSDCTVDPGEPACQPAGDCGECSATNDVLCVDNRPLCLVDEGRCGCTDVDGDSECGAVDSGIICSGPSGLCVPGCAIAPGRNHCPTDQFCSEQNGDVGTCSPQPCLTDDDCEEPQPYCETSQQPNVCVECLDTADCPTPLLCDTANGWRCVECTPGDLSNCSEDGSGAACLSDGTCGCYDDTDCGASDSGRVCGPSDVCINGCRGAGGNGCPAPLACTSVDDTIGSCVVPDECQDDGDCPPDRPLCDIDASPKICVACLDAGDCPIEAPVCDLYGECVGCSDDSECTDPLYPACHTSGDLAGQCTECSASNSSLCVGDKPQCFDELGFCGCSSLDGDSECGAVDSGRVCDGPIGLCIDGCIIHVGRNHCPADQYCTDQTGGIGACLDHCMSNDDCTVAPELVCDDTALPHVCVECLIDDECSAETVCDEDARVCVECTETKLDNCTADGKGSICLEDQTCGCLVDSDCGATDSGRVCGEDSLCTTGCRGSDGNGCPEGYHCSSTTSEIGECLPDETPDGGTGGSGGEAAAGGSGGDAGSGAVAGSGTGATGGVGASGGSAGAAASGNSGVGLEVPGGSGMAAEGGGCGCAVPGSQGSSRGGWAVLAALACLVRRRRSRPAGG